MTLDPRKQPKHEIPEPDPIRVKELLGKTLLIGVTYESHTGDIIERKQAFGPITEISRKGGIVIRDQISGATFALPPDLQQLHQAPKGSYTLKPSGLVITDPDYTSQWTSRRSPPPKT
jgi:hypothetical protein